MKLAAVSLLNLLFLSLPALAGPASSSTNLWTLERIDQAEQSLAKLKVAGLISEHQLQRKQAMLEARRAGRFHPTALSHSNPKEFNLLQNAGFEQVNRNSAKNRSRWLWWGGWSWGGDYENFWESRPAYVHSGQFSAGFRCTGKAGRIGINTPKLPIVPGARHYRFQVWAKGEGNNQLFLNFESGASGALRRKIGPAWQLVTLEGTPAPDAQDFSFFIYITGEGTIWLDDAKLVPEN